MILPKEQITRAERGEDIDSSRKRGSSTFRLWPNGVVPYEIDPSLGKLTFSITTTFTPTFIVTCIAAIVRNTPHVPTSSFDPPNKQESKYTNHNPLAKKLAKEVTLNEHWHVIGVFRSLFVQHGRKTLKDDVKRWMSKDWFYVHNTESECKNMIIFFFNYWQNRQIQFV